MHGTQRYLQIVWLLFLIAFPIVLWILPSTFFDNTGVELCPSKAFFDIECLGCGMTRGIMHLHHFEISDALYYNGLSFLVYPGLIVNWLIWVVRAMIRLDYLNLSDSNVDLLRRVHEKAKSGYSLPQN